MIVLLQGMEWAAPRTSRQKKEASFMLEIKLNQFWKLDEHNFSPNLVSYQVCFVRIIELDFRKITWFPGLMASIHTYQMQ